MLANGRVYKTILNEAFFGNDEGRLVGVLRQYPIGACADSPLYEKVIGEYSVAVKPRYQRQGIGLALLAAADQKWGLDFWCQKFTPQGRQLAIAYLNAKHAAASST